MATKCIYPNLSAELARNRMAQETLSNKMDMDTSTLSLKMTGK